MKNKLEEAIGNISSKIKSERIAQRYSQQALADACGLTKQTIHNLETGKHQATLRTISAVMDVLEIDFWKS